MKRQMAVCVLVLRGDPFVIICNVWKRGTVDLDDIESAI